MSDNLILNEETGEYEFKDESLNHNNYKSEKQYYEAFSDKIGRNQFGFKGGIYRFDETKEKIICIKHPDANNFIRVIGDFYKYVLSPITQKIILGGWDDKALNIDYDHVPRFKQMIPAYDGFCVVPSNTNFQRVINKHYNMYEPIHHTPKKGDFPNIKLYFQHIFEDSLEMGYDYFSISWKYPTRKLPILSLVSRETATGKTTMIDFMRAIWGDNAVMVGNKDITTEFNAPYITKLIVGLDEGFIEKKSVLEMIKSLSTALSANYNNKFSKAKPIPCHLHFVVCTNNERNFVNMEAQDSRFWVLKIKSVKNTVNKLLEKMIAEIPAFLDFIENRTMSIEDEDRLWFGPQRFETEAKNVMIAAALPRNVKVLNEFLDEYFEKTTRKVVNFTKSDLNDILKAEGGTGGFDHSFLSDYMKYEKSSKARLDDRSTPYATPLLTTKEFQRYFTFFAVDYMKPELYAELFPEPVKPIAEPVQLSIDTTEIVELPENPEEPTF